MGGQGHRARWETPVLGSTPGTRRKRSLPRPPRKMSREVATRDKKCPLTPHGGEPPFWGRGLQGTPAANRLGKGSKDKVK